MNAGMAGSSEVIVTVLNLNNTHILWHTCFHLPHLHLQVAGPKAVPAAAGGPAQGSSRQRAQGAAAV
jgi:hypothetical protein